MADLADDVRRDAKTAYGVVPNLFEEVNQYTGMPSAVYMDADETLSDGVLSARQRQAVLLELARYHSSRYDAVVHARIGLDLGLSPQDVDRILAGDSPDDEDLAPFIEAARRSCEERGWLDATIMRDLQQRGVGRGALYEIFALIGMKTFSSYTSHIAGTEVDGALESTQAVLENIPDKPADLKRKRLFLG